MRRHLSLRERGREVRQELRFELRLRNIREAGEPVLGEGVPRIARIDGLEVLDERVESLRLDARRLVRLAGVDLS